MATTDHPLMLIIGDTYTTDAGEAPGYSNYHRRCTQITCFNAAASGGATPVWVWAATERVCRECASSCQQGADSECAVNPCLMLYSGLCNNWGLTYPKGPTYMPVWTPSSEYCTESYETICMNWIAVKEHSYTYDHVFPYINKCEATLLPANAYGADGYVPIGAGCGVHYCADKCHKDYQTSVHEMYDNCNCGGFNCYSNCNCNCDCNCNCNC